jgi:hypothetical protein
LLPEQRFDQIPADLGGERPAGTRTDAYPLKRRTVMKRRTRFGLIAFAGLAALGSLQSARADSKLEARYLASLAGIPIGSGTWIVDVGEGRYLAAASGSTTGLLRVFLGGQGTSAARGILSDGHLVSSTYAATINTQDTSSSVRLTISDGNVKDAKVEPPVDHDPDRVPITREHGKGVLDPMTASLIRAPRTGSALTPEACNRTLPIFDGRLRYDLKLAFKRMDTVHAQQGYVGAAVVCSVGFEPLAGHIPSRTAMKYLMKQRNIEIWLAPIGTTRVLVPFRAEGPTPIGKAVLEATQFVSVATSTPAAADKQK